MVRARVSTILSELFRVRHSIGFNQHENCGLRARILRRYERTGLA